MEQRLNEERLELCMPSVRMAPSGNQSELSDEIKAFTKGWVAREEEEVFEMP